MKDQDLPTVSARFNGVPKAWNSVLNDLITTKHNELQYEFAQKGCPKQCPSREAVRTQLFVDMVRREYDHHYQGSGFADEIAQHFADSDAMPRPPSAG